MKTIGDLKAYLEKNDLSPEVLAPEVKISNMTLRRMLQKPANTKIPEKYLFLFQSLSTSNAFTEKNIDDYLETEGASLTGNSPEKIDQFAYELDDKIKKTKIETSFMDKIILLRDYAFSSKNLKIQAIAFGALLYFVNPFDLIPDFSGPLGYVDDLGVVTAALGTIAKIIAKGPSS